MRTDDELEPPSGASPVRRRSPRSRATSRGFPRRRRRRGSSVSAPNALDAERGPGFARDPAAPVREPAHLHPALRRDRRACVRGVRRRLRDRRRARHQRDDRLHPGAAGEALDGSAPAARPEPRPGRARRSGAGGGRARARTGRCRARRGRDEGARGLPRPARGRARRRRVPADRGVGPRSASAAIRWRPARRWRTAPGCCSWARSSCGAAGGRSSPRRAPAPSSDGSPARSASSARARRRCSGGWLASPA